MLETMQQQQAAPLSPTSGSGAAGGSIVDSASATVPSDLKTLWMGNVQPNWDESYVASLLRPVAEPMTVRITRYNGSAAGYAFIDFASQDAARAVLEQLNNTRIGESGLTFKLNWGVGGMRRSLGAPNEFSLFVGDLPHDVTDNVLLEAFSALFPSCSTAKVVIDSYSGLSKGYGFVRFTDKSHCDAAIASMNGTLIQGRPVRVSHATAPARRTGSFSSGMAPPGAQGMPFAYMPYPADRGGAGMMRQQAPMLMSTRTSEESVSSPEMSVGSLSMGYEATAAAMGGFTASAATPENTTVFVGNLDPAVTESQLQAHFQSYGAIVQVKIPPNRGCGFVKFDTHDCAEKALMALQGTLLCSQRIRLDWGKASAQRQQQQQQQQQQQATAAMIMADPNAMAFAAQYGGYYMQPWTGTAAYPTAAYYTTQARYPTQQYMAVAATGHTGVMPVTGRYPQEYMQQSVPLMSQAGAMVGGVDVNGATILSEEANGGLEYAAAGMQQPMPAQWNGIVQ